MRRSRFVIFAFLACLLLLAPSRANVSAVSSSTVRDLPPAAQAMVSNVLGRDRTPFHWTSGNGSWQAANSNQSLSAEFNPSGLQVTIGHSTWGLSLREWGLGADLQTVAAAAPVSTAANRLDIARGALSEWYINGPAGLEQGFSVQAPPASASQGPLTLVLQLQGDLTAQLNSDRAGLVLVDGRGQSVLRYGGLSAADATGRSLPAWMELRGQTLALLVDDAQAQYPVLVDPMFEAAQLVSSDGNADDAFGYSVAISGKTLVVGAPSFDTNGAADQGQAYVFVKPKTGWHAQLTDSAKLRSSDGAAGDNFGISVAISGNTIVVGAWDHAVGSNGQQGEAYVFSKPKNGWANTLNENAILLASDGSLGDLFGSSVAINGNTIVVGARNRMVGGNFGQGQAYVFVKPRGDWHGTLNENARLKSSDGAASDAFGHTVAVSANTVVVGAPIHKVGANGIQGEAYVFVRPKTGWNGFLTETARLNSSDGAAGDLFGWSVGINGNSVVVGAPNHAVGNNAQQGQAYAYFKPKTGWNGTLNENAMLRSSDGQVGDQFGMSLAINATTVVIGAPLHNIGTNVDQGAAYIFVKPKIGWSGIMTENAQLLASDGASGDEFGASVMVSGPVVVIGAPSHQVGVNLLQGQGYVFVRPRAGWK